MGAAPRIQIGSFNCPVEYGEDMHAGYVTSRRPAHCATASCVRTRKLNSVAGWAKQVILHEYTSLDGFNHDYEAANSKSPLGVGGHNVDIPRARALRAEQRASSVATGQGLTCRLTTVAACCAPPVSGGRADGCGSIFRRGPQSLSNGKLKLFWEGMIK
jgi:hypothetical protein